MDILELLELAEGVASTHEFRECSVRFEAFNNEDNIVNLVGVQHALDKLVQGVDRLRPHEFKFGSQLLLHGTTKKADFEIALGVVFILIEEDGRTIVSVFED